MTRRALVLWVLAVVSASAAFVVHLSLRFEAIRLGYEVGAARREQHKLIDTKRLFTIESATLKEPSRVESVARGSLGMTVPTPDQTVVVGRGTSAGAAGKVR